MNPLQQSAPQAAAPAAPALGIGRAGWAMAALCACTVPMEFLEDPLWDTGSQVVQKLIWLLTVVVGLRRYRPRDTRPWWCLIAFFAITGVRNVIRFLGVLEHGKWTFAPGSLPELLAAVAFSFPLIAASVIIMRNRRPRGDWAFADAWVMGVCALLVGACLVTIPIFAEQGASPAFFNLGVVAVLRNALILVPLVAISFSDMSQIRSFQVYFFGMLLTFASELYFVASQGTRVEPGLSKTVFTLGIATGQSLVAGSALLASMREVTSPSTTPRPPWSLARALGMLTAVLAPVAAFVLGGPYGPTEQQLLGAGFGVLLVLMVVRLRLAVVVATGSEARLQQLANHDVLTGLPNRRYLHSVLTHGLQAEVNRHGVLTLACCYIDLDNLKDINDRSGHHAGDRLIQTVASALRRLPAAAQSTAVRVGGDEFLVLAPVRAEQAALHARQLADRVSLSIQRRPATALDPSEASEARASIGSSWSTLTATGSVEAQLNHLIDQADLAQVEAKRSGGARVSEFDSRLSTQARRRTSISRHIQHAWAQGQMSLVYQPVVNLLDGRVYGVESLLRWQHPELGLVSPPEAIQAAGRQGLIDDLGLSVLERALADIARIAPEKRVRVGVNLAGEQLQPASVDRIIQRITDSGLSRWLWLEITEQALVESRHFVARSLEELRSSGVVIAIDDFGTGYCGLDYLCTLPVDIVKLDGVFAREAAQSLTRRRVAQLGVQLAQAVGAVTLAEGIEDRAAAELMRDMGCTFGQGYAIGRPLADLAQAALRNNLVLAA